MCAYSKISRTCRSIVLSMVNYGFKKNNFGLDIRCQDVWSDKPFMHADHHSGSNCIVCAIVVTHEKQTGCQTFHPLTSFTQAHYLISTLIS